MFGTSWEDEDIGFRPKEAVELAAAMFPGLPPEADPLGDGTGRRIDQVTGEITPAPVLWTLGISGGLIRVRVTHGRTPKEIDDQDLIDGGHWERDEDTDNSDVDGPAEPKVRDVVSEFSRRSRNRLRVTAASVDWEGAYRPGLKLLMVTLTYPADWRTAAPTPEEVTRHRKAFIRRFHRVAGHPLPHIWKREFQERGAPHLHLYGWWPQRMGNYRLTEWLSQTWWEIVGTGDADHLRAGTGVDWKTSLRMTDPLRVGIYFACYVTHNGDNKEYQNEAPEAWANPNGSVGRYWGVMGLERLLAEVPLTQADTVTVERLLRGVLRGNARNDTDWRRPRTKRTRYSRTGRGPGGLRKRWIHRRYSLTTLKGVDQGFNFLTNDGARLAYDIARALNLPDTTPWPRGQRRPLP